jgi:exosortase H (IPTLxxWG-CTERM-specific)
VRRHKKIKAQPGSGAKAAPAWQRWWASKGPLFRVGASFIGLIVLFSAISLAPVFQNLLAKCVQLDAKLAGKILNGLGQGTHRAGSTLVSSRFAMTVINECSASEFVIFLWASILAFPATLRRKIVGLALGTLAVGFVNLVRLVTLFLVGVYRPHFFTPAHEELWPGLFVIAVIFFIIGWVSWATRREQSHAAA